jgi:hypothetical protein
MRHHVSDILPNLATLHSTTVLAGNTLLRD